MSVEKPDSIQTESTSQCGLCGHPIKFTDVVCQGCGESTTHDKTRTFAGSSFLVAALAVLAAPFIGGGLGVLASTAAVTLCLGPWFSRRSCVPGNYLAVLAFISLAVVGVTRYAIIVSAFTVGKAEGTSDGKHRLMPWVTTKDSGYKPLEQFTVFRNDCFRAYAAGYSKGFAVGRDEEEERLRKIRLRN